MLQFFKKLGGLIRHIYYFRSLPPKYTGIARRIFQVDYSNGNDVGRYSRDFAVKSYVIPKRGTVPETVIETDSLYLPYMTLAVNPMPSITDRTKNWRKEAAERAFDAMTKQEDAEAINLINSAVPTHQSLSATLPIQVDNIAFACKLLKESNIQPGAILVYPSTTFFLEQSDDKRLKFAKKKYPLIGWLKDIPIYESTMVPKNAVYVVGEKKQFGAMTIKYDRKVYAVTDYKKLREGFVIFSTLGIGIINDYTVARILIVPKSTNLNPKIIDNTDAVNVEQLTIPDAKEEILAKMQEYSSDVDV